MIYKCKNCGLEYAENPEYCDCGNNVFICLNNGVPLEEEFSTSEIKNPQNMLKLMNMKKMMRMMTNRNMQNLFHFTSQFLFSVLSQFWRLF